MVILLRNLCRQEKLMNGTKLLVMKIHKTARGWRTFCFAVLLILLLPQFCCAHAGVVMVQAFHGKKKRYLIPRICFGFDRKGDGFAMVRLQLPFRPAYAMTIHKSQGGSLGRCAIVMQSKLRAMHRADDQLAWAGFELLCFHTRTAVRRCWPRKEQRQHNGTSARFTHTERRGASQKHRMG